MITEQEKRIARRLKGPSQMERVKAARAYIGTVRSQAHAEELELHAFMAIFHPEVSADMVRKMARDRQKK